jgi:hypothetical protein
MRCPAALLFLPLVALAADPPSAEISNSALRARLYLPDAETGYYRATRFDWSGVIASLNSKDHSYFGQWFERYDPKLHDSITGPAESFEAIGYDEAAVGGRFLRIGVGWLKKPEEPRVNNFRTYEILDSGKWSVSGRGQDWIEFTQELPGAYVYRKKVSLDGDRLVIEHRLRNTRNAPLETQVFNHDFYMLDNQPTGPNIGVTFAFDPATQADWRGPGELRGKELAYRDELPKGVSVYGELKGYPDTAAANQFVVADRKTGASVRQTGDRPMSRLYFWSIRTTVCPEAYVRVHADPGKEDAWKITYEFR